MPVSVKFLHSPFPLRVHPNTFEFLLLRRLVVDAPQTVSTLSAGLTLSHGQVQRALRRLQAKELVLRTPSQTAHAQYELTGLGQLTAEHVSYRHEHY